MANRYEALLKLKHEGISIMTFGKIYTQPHVVIFVVIPIAMYVGQLRSFEYEDDTFPSYQLSINYSN